MTKGLLMSLVIVPVLLAVGAARSRGLRGLPGLIASLLAFDLSYMLLLYYLHRRWM